MGRVRVLLIGITVAALFATGCEWHFETLDGHQSGPSGQVNGNVGEDNAAVLYNGRPHVFYYDGGGGDLRHAYYNGSFWAFETLDGTGGPNGRINADVGNDNSAMLYNGRPHVFYRASGGNLRHGYYNGSFWAFETLDGEGGPNGRIDGYVGYDSAAMLYNGRPHVFYFDDDGGGLRHAYYNGQFWAFETLDGTDSVWPGHTTHPVGTYSAVLIYNGRPHVFYYDYTDGALRRTYYNGTNWVFETLDGNGGSNGRTTNDVGLYNTLVLYNGQPHVFYYDAADKTLRHGWLG